VIRAPVEHIQLVTRDLHKSKRVYSAILEEVLAVATGRAFNETRVSALCIVALPGISRPRVITRMSRSMRDRSLR
jgi:hypothetical protein